VKDKIIPYLSYGLSFVVFCFICFSVYRIITTSAPDFSVYYGATENLVSDISPYSNSSLYTGFGYPPLTAVLFLPFLLFPARIAQGIFILFSALSIPCIVWFLLRVFQDKQSGLPTLLIITSLIFLLFPTRFTLGMGQSNLVTLLFVSGAMFEWVHGKKYLSYLLFGLALCLKPQLVLVVPFIVLTGEWAFAVGSLGIVVGAGIVSGILFGWERYIQYYQDMVLTLLPYAGREIYYNQGFAGFFARVFPQYIASISTVCSSTILYILSLFRVIKFRINFPVSLALGLCVMVLIEPLSWQHHIVFLFPAFVFLWITPKISRISTILLVCSILLVGYNIRQPELFNNIVIGPLLLSHGFIGTLIVTTLMLMSVRKLRT
jgi:alpha-1,2-mannosyltransferase